MDKVSSILDRYTEMQQEKAPWIPLYSLISEFVHIRKQDFISDDTPRGFIIESNFDNTAAQSLYLMSSTFIGAMWPNGARSFRIDPPYSLRDNADEEVKDFYSRVTQTMAEVLDAPECGMSLALEEYLNDQGAYGIAGLGVFETDDPEFPIRITPYDAKCAFVDEGLHNMIDVVYTVKSYTIRQAVLEFGLENLHKETQDAFKKNKLSSKIKVLHAIEPRMQRDPNKSGAKDMPVASVHIDIEHKHILRESGYHEMPVFVARFWKLTGEKQGRSPAMLALPDITEMNAIREAYELAHEKNLDPPMALYDDSALGGGTIDTSAGAVTVFSPSGRLGNGQKPFDQLITVGELQSTITRIAELKEIIKNHFFIDRLLDLNNETRMTLGEANIRNDLRGQSLGTSYTRQFNEMLSRLLQRAFNILLRRGRFGVLPGSKEEMDILASGLEPNYIPEAVIRLMNEGKDAYKITYISPAARILEGEELMGIQKLSEYAAGMAPLIPEILDNANWDKMFHRFQALCGAPIDTINAMDSVTKIRDARAKMQAAQAQNEAAREASETARNLAQATPPEPQQEI